MTWKLQTINGEFAGQEINIDRDMLVGRHQDADLVLAAAEISRRHAAFLIKDQALYVQDLKSSNGTFINEKRVEGEALLKEGDIVQFASLKFSVLAPAQAKDALQPTQAIQQPAEAIATSELPVTAAVEENEVKTAPVEQAVTEQVAEKVEQQPEEKTAAQIMNDQGMPDLKERDASVQLTRDGMPQNVGIPKPAPIPEGVDLTANPVEREECRVDIPQTCVEQEKETQKNASIGLMSLIVLIIVAIVAWFIFN